MAAEPGATKQLTEGYTAMIRLTDNPVYFEPTDPPEPRVVVVSPALFERLRHTLGAVEEADAEGRVYVRFNDRLFTTAVPR